MKRNRTAKLSLAKTTIRALGEGQLQAVAGGFTGLSCLTLCTASVRLGCTGVCP